MARYFFHVQQSGTLLEDSYGADFPGLEDVRREAILAAREMIGEALRGGSLPLSDQFVVADENGQTVLVVPFSDAATVS